MTTHLIGFGRHYVAVVALSQTVDDQVGQRHTEECMKEQATGWRLAGDQILHRSLYFPYNVDTIRFIESMAIV